MSSKNRSDGRSVGQTDNGTRVTDPRFEGIQKSSLYRRPSNKKTRVTLDKRFASVLTDERFSSKAKVDRYGRKLRKTQDGKDGKKNAELSKLYRVDDEEVEAESIDEDEEVQAELSRVNNQVQGKGYDPARDGGFEDSSSSEESSSEEEDEAEEDLEEDMAALPANEANAGAVPEGQITRRLAVVNLDWDNIRAVDLLAVFNSYASSSAVNDRVEKVTIYPSEFGKERMEREEMEGPPKELFANKKVAHNGSVQRPLDESSDDSDNSTDEEDENEDEDEDERIRKSLVQEDQGEEFSSTKLRSYQLERLRYFYAVVDCSNPQVAKEIYDNVDGREYLSSANFFDLRFIPDELDFSEDKPREECSKLPHKYRPNEFVTAALQHSKVKLTWDAEDTQRKDIQQRAFGGSRKDIDENELRAYLASDNSSDEEETEVVEVVDSTIGNTSVEATQQAPASRKSKSELKRLEMRAKLGLTDESPQKRDEVKPVGDMQITFTAGLSTSDIKDSVFENEPEIEETTAERYIRKERERKARRKEKLKAERSGGNEEDEPVAAEPPKDVGFDDAFFTATPAEAEASAAQKKADKAKERRAKRAAEEKAAAVEAAELERILKLNTKNNGNTETSHFSMSALEKAEKAVRKQKLKKGKGRLSQSEKAALEAKAKDDFEMDVEDKRFAAVYERPEFALDPSHPRFRDTQGMKSLLHEARERRKRDIEEEEDDEMVRDTQAKRNRR